MSKKNLYINGAWVRGSGPNFTSTDPATGKTLWEGSNATAANVDHAVKSAHTAFRDWTRYTTQARGAYLEQFAECLMKNTEELATLISEETGKPDWESRTEVAAMIGKVAISLRANSERCQAVKKARGAHTSWTRYKPHGVVGVFGPFNLPGHLPNGHIIPALLSGNTIVFKPSEQTPRVGEKLVAYWESVGLPKGVLNLVQGGRETAVALSTHAALNGLFFTGSSKTGKEIHKAFAGQPEKILALEMGGNNPLIVTKVSDLDAAAYLTIQSAFITSGQRCVCARRLIVLQDRNGDAFIERLVAMTQKIQVGAHVNRPEPFMGPVISDEAAQNVLDWQDRLTKEGGESLIKAAPLGTKKSLLTPGMMDTTAVKRRPDVEIFGPFLQVIRVKDFDHAVQEANQTAYGLAAGLLSEQRDEYERFFAECRAGIMNWNQQITGASSEAPFGGVGQSGNHQPSAYFAADYCSYPVASLESNQLAMPRKRVPGIEL